MPPLQRACPHTAYRDIARLLKLDDTEKEDTKELFLIIDNTDDKEVVKGGEQSGRKGIRDFISRNDYSRILFITQARRLAVRLAQTEVVNLSQINKDKASDLLNKSLVDKSLLLDKKSIATLLEILTYLPLAIVQAAVYLNEITTSVAEYLRLLQNTERDIVELLETEFVDNTRYKPLRHKTANVVARTFIAHVESKAIPRSILPAVGSDYSFLSIQEDRRTYNIHQLVHVASRMWVSRQDTASKQRREVLVHLGAIFSTDEYLLTEGRSREAVKADGWVKKAISLLERVVAVRETTLAETHPDRLASQHVKKAVELLEHVVAVEETTLAEKHPDRIESEGWLDFLRSHQRTDS
ncbi:hypothetical protein B0T11DRAFT_306468 [Plectosphaerella cucumerina]|uniref:Uncharacterized protein n=1 Tax=Plectosphaerella cucumerina TaxID=40658 RepID=A0A8K0TBS6_9PEZI|nr:hypothetical protein B0T11DRAFT_306468 [Plectosphaerella cucumerina]